MSECPDCELMAIQLQTYKNDCRVFDELYRKLRTDYEAVMLELVHLKRKEQA